MSLKDLNWIFETKLAYSIPSPIEILTGDRNYYVDPTGDDANDGSITDPFKTIQRAIDAVSRLDLNRFSAYINIADGTYTEDVVINRLILNGYLYIWGNQANPENVIINSNASSLNFTDCEGIISIEGLTLNSTNGNCIWADNTRSLKLGIIRYGSALNAHILLSNSSRGYQRGKTDYEIFGNAIFNISLTENSYFVMIGNGTCTNNPAFTIFYNVDSASYLDCSGALWTNGGTVTGTQYAVNKNGILDSKGGLAGIPGNVGGGVTNQGQAL